MSATSSGGLGTGHSLELNDLHQTPQQWDEWMLREVGAITAGGTFVQFAKAGKKPTAPGNAPHKPTEPKTIGLVTEYQRKIGDKRFSELALLHANDASLPAPVRATIPAATELEVWDYYGALLSDYQSALKTWEAEFDICHSKFPEANKAVFAKVESCISATSMLVIRRDAQGNLAYESQDAFGLRVAALRLHNAVEVTVVQTTVKVAKTGFEGYMQNSADSVATFMVEFERRLDNLATVKGKLRDDVYEDYELRDFLLAGLYGPTWDKWKERRLDSGTMPVTFGELKVVLNAAETNRVNDAKAAGILSYSSHGTDSKVADPKTSASVIKICEGLDDTPCGKRFTARDPDHKRCDDCQKKKRLLNSKKSNKSDKKKPNKVSDAKRVRPVARKKAHDTRGVTFEHGDEIEYEDEDEEEQYANATDALNKSFSRFSYNTSGNAVETESLNTSARADTDVYFDPASNTMTVKHDDLAVAINERGSATRVSGSVPGGIVVKRHGQVGTLGRAPIDESFSKNIVAEKTVRSAGYDVIHDTRVSNDYFCEKRGAKTLTFKLNSTGTYSMSMTEFMACFPEVYGVTANANDGEPVQRVFTKAQRERAFRYHHDHQHCLHHIHGDRVRRALRNGLVEEPLYTAADVLNAEAIYGPCPECAKTKGTKHRQTGHYPHTPTRPGERLVGDLFVIMGMLFMLVSCRMIKLRILRRLRNKSASQIMMGIDGVVGIWKGYNHAPSVISWDQEPALVHSKHEVWAKHGVKMEFVAPGSHERVAERDGRTVKEHVYATILGLGHAVDAQMVEGITQDTVTLLNYFPNSETEDESPRAFLDGERLNYARWSRFHAGQVGVFEIPYPDKKGSRKETGYIICHQGDNPVVRLLPSGQRLVVRSGHFTPQFKTPAIIELIERGIVGAKRQEYQDLLAEIEEFQSEPVATINIDEAPDTPGVNSRDEPSVQNHPIGMVAPTVIIPPHLDSGEAYSDISFTQPVSLPSVPASARPDSASAEVQGRVEDPQPVQPVHPVPFQGRSGQPPPQPANVGVHPPPAPPGQVQTVSQRPVRAKSQREPGFYAQKNYTGAPTSQKRAYLTERRATQEFIAECQANHMMAAECAKIAGKERQEAAGLDEVINIIGREGLEPTDYKKLTSEQISGALPSFMFYKTKDLLPDERDKAIREAAQTARDSDPHTQPWQEVKSKKTEKKERVAMYKVKARWVGGGNRQSRDSSFGDKVAPTARSPSHALLLAIAALERRPVRVGDVPSAYLQTEHVSENGEDLYIVADRATTELITTAYPDLETLVRPNGTMILRVVKALYGLIESAWLWYQELIKTLEGIGYTVLDADRGLVVKRTFKGGACVGSNFLSIHVDDILAVPSNNKAGQELDVELWTHLETKWPGIKLQKGPRFKHLSWDIEQDPKTGRIMRSQGSALKKMLGQFGVTRKEKRPSRANLLTRDTASKPLSPAARDEYVRKVATVNFYRDGRADIDFVVGHLQRHQVNPTEQDASDLDHLLGYIHRFPDRPMIFEPKDAQLRAYCDASFALDDDNSYYGYIYSIGGSTIASKGGRIKTVVRSSHEAEGTCVNEALSELLWARDVMIELGYTQEAIPIAEDNESLIRVFQHERRNFQTKSKHVRLKWKFFRQQRENGLVYLTYCPTEQMRADILTKPMGGNGLSRHADAIQNGRLEDDWDIR